MAAAAVEGDTLVERQYDWLRHDVLAAAERQSRAPAATAKAIANLATHRPGHKAAAAESNTAVLPHAQFKSLVMASMDAMSALRAQHVAHRVVSDLVPFLKHPDADYREHAVAALLQQACHMPRADATPVRWLCLPSVGDPSLGVRLALSRAVRGLGHIIDHQVTPSPNDTPVGTCQIPTSQSTACFLRSRRQMYCIPPSPCTLR